MAAKEASWDMIASARRSNTAHIGPNCAVSRHTYHWLMTNHALVMKKIVADSDGAADCRCNEPETQWHIVEMGSQQLPNDNEVILSNA